MKYLDLGKTGYRISSVTYGGVVSASVFDDVDTGPGGQEWSDRWVSWAVDQGVNYFDVAPTYGNAELLMGNSLRPYRDKVYLACKTNLRRSAEAFPEMEKSLKLLHTDYFDNYQIHGLAAMEEVDIAFGPGGVVEMMRDMKEKGIARKLGFTAHSEAAALRAIDLFDFDTVMFPFNWHLNMEHGMGNALLKKAKEKGMGILGIKSMIDRRWFSKEEKHASPYPKSWCRPFDIENETELLTAAIRYTLSLGVDAIVPPGNFEHFKFGVTHFDEIASKPFSPEEQAILRARLEQVREYPFLEPECWEL